MVEPGLDIAQVPGIGGDVLADVGLADQPFAHTPVLISLVVAAGGRSYAAPVNRDTPKGASAEEGQEAHGTFAARGKELGVTEVWDLEAQGKNEASFIFADMDRNWWEVTSAAWPLP